MKTACEHREIIPTSFTTSPNTFRNTELYTGTDKNSIIQRWLTRRRADKDELRLKQWGQYRRDAVFLCIQWTLLNFSTETWKWRGESWSYCSVQTVWRIFRNQLNKVILVTTRVVSYSSCRFCFCETNTGPFLMKQNAVLMEGMDKNDDVKSRWWSSPWYQEWVGRRDDTVWILGWCWRWTGIGKWVECVCIEVPWILGELEMDEGEW